MADVTQTPDDILRDLIKKFDDAIDSTITARDEAEIARQYYDGVQWTDEEIETLGKRKQPVITDNMLKDKVEYIIGLELASRTDPKAYPRTPQHEQDAEAVTDALRFIGDANDFPQVKSDVAENMFVEGFGGAEIYIRKKGGENDIVIKRNRWERCFYDPHSSNKDFSDARYLGTFVWMDLEEAKDLWPDKDTAWNLAAVDMAGSGSDQDKPRNNFVDRTRRRIRIIEIYCKKSDGWYRAKFCKYDFLEPYAESPYEDEDGEPEHPYAWESAYVDGDNQRYGIIRRYKSLQDEVNHRRSRALHILNTNQVVLEDGAVDDVEATRREANKPDGVIVKRQGYELEILKNIDLAAGQAQLLEQSRESLSTTGPKAFQQSTPSQSGRAKQIDRQADVLELGRLFDTLRHFQKATYRKAWNRVKQFWTEEKWVRIRDDEGAPKFVKLNEPITAQMAAQEISQTGGVVPPDLQLILSQNPQAVVGIKNHTAQLDVDIVIDESPDVVNLQAEQFANLVDLAKAGVIFPQEVYVEASSLRNKAKLIEKLKGGDDPQAQAQAAQEAAQAKDIAKRGAEAEVAATEAKAAETSEKAKQLKIENLAGAAGLAGLASGP